MSTPKVVNWSWKNTIPQFLIFLAVMILSVAPYPERKLTESAMIGAFGYLAYSYLSRFLLTRYHRAGMQAFQKGEYEKAIECYAKSRDFFEKYPAIDRLRSVVMLTPSVWSYREMAMMNSAFTFSQMGDGDRSLRAYEELLEEYPGNSVAVQALRMLNSSKTKN